MKIHLQPGLYVIAVSGGVDSVALLHILAQIYLKNTDTESRRFIIAHYDHGIRQDSFKDRQLVQKLAAQYKIPFVYEEGRLGNHASEDTARRARYDFLHTVRQKSKAMAIVIAHHQDDKLETAVINMLRGTGRKGLSSLQSTEYIVRPLLDVPKEDLLTYAHKNKLQWNEDDTNKDVRYLRNYVRIKIMPKFSASNRRALLNIVDSIGSLNQLIDFGLIDILHQQPAVSKLYRQAFITLPHNVACELVVQWLRQNNCRNINKLTVERLVVSCKTYQYGKQIDVNSNTYIEVGMRDLALEVRDR